MKCVELIRSAEDRGSFRTHREGTNSILHTTAAGEGYAFIVASVPREEDTATAACALYAMIAEALHEQGMAIVHERIFGNLSVEAAVLRERQAALSEQQVPADGPITYVEGVPPWGEGLAGVIIHAVYLDRADDVWTITDRSYACGRGWRRNG